MMGKQTMAVCLLLLSAAAWAEVAVMRWWGNSKLSTNWPAVTCYRKWPKSNLETPMSAKKAV